jgi:hypothetical protein
MHARNNLISVFVRNLCSNATGTRDKNSRHMGLKRPL